MIKIRKSKKIKYSGIYQVSCYENNKIYIGSTGRGISTRIFRDHYQSLKNNRHPNIYLQNHVNKYGIDDLLFDVIQFVYKRRGETILQFKERLLEREQFWIDKLKPEFNICQIAGSTLGMKHTEEWKGEAKKRMTGKTNPMKNPQTQKLISEQHKEYYKTPAGIRKIKKMKFNLHNDEVIKRRSKTRSTPVNQYNKNGKFIASYYGMSEAARQIGRSPGQIINCINHPDTYHTAGGFIWTKRRKPTEEQIKNTKKYRNYGKQF